MGYKTLEVRSGQQQSWNRSLTERMRNTVWQAGCRSWYLNRHGRNTTLWPDFTWRFRFQTRRFDQAAYNVESLEK